MHEEFHAVLVIAFGGPERIEDVRPFLAKVTRGRIPQERLEKVAHHYELFGGKSPVTEVTFRQAEALKGTLRNRGIPVLVYVGMRNWHPFLADTLQQMGQDGVRGAVALIMSVFESRSSWDQYKSDVAGAMAQAGMQLRVSYTEPLFDQPGFVNAVSNRVKECLEQIPTPYRDATCLLFTAHSLPYSDPGVEIYAQQVEHTATSVAGALGHANWHVAYQSRSGRPQDPWLEPDVNPVLRELGAMGVKHVVAVPIGFVCDNVEVLYDLDIEAMSTAKHAGITLLRAKTVNDDQVFIETLADLVTKVTQSAGEDG
jgi:ferrochelatase